MSDLKQLTERQLECLRQTALFQSVSDSEAVEVARAANTVLKKADESFFQQGRKANRFYILLGGRIKVVHSTPEGHQVVARYVSPGELFGCVPLFGGDTYPGTAMAVTESKAFSWDARTIRKFMLRMPTLALSALDLLGSELTELRNRFKELATERVERRIAHAVLRLLQQAGEETASGVKIDFPLTRQDLAELTGTTLHTVSRVLSSWEEQGFVTAGRKKLFIKQRQKIVSIAEDLNLQE